MVVSGDTEAAGNHQGKFVNILHHNVTAATRYSKQIPPGGSKKSLNKEKTVRGLIYRFIGDQQRMKRLIIVAGPNDALKTTLALQYLPREAACPASINADPSMAGLAPI